MAIKSSGLAVYIAKQIYQGKLDYEKAVAKFPGYKNIIDETLKELNIIPVVEEE